MSITILGKYTRATCYAEDVEEQCLSQIQTLCDHPAFTAPIAIMPDAHSGKGAVIGFTMPMGTALVPSVVGVDIGCGMLAIKIPEWGQEGQRDRLIRETIPMGFDTGDNPMVGLSDFQKFLPAINAAIGRFAVRMGLNYAPFMVDDATIYDLFQQHGGKRAWASIGSLGGGNHFIEVDVCGAKNEYWLVIHTGSRNFGKLICESWEKTALTNGPDGKKLFQERKKAVLAAAERGEIPRTEIESRIRSWKNLEARSSQVEPAWLEGKDALGYLRDMLVAQAYATLNRNAIAKIICELMNFPLMYSFETVHNYISPVDFIIRKGAVAAHRGQQLLIPLNMADGCLMATGLGNPEWNESAPHGAGRLMSRTRAKKELSVEDYRKRMSSVFSSAEPGMVLDEAPAAYKPPASIVGAISGQTVTITGRLTPIHNIKAESSPRFQRESVSVCGRPGCGTAL